MSVIIDATVHVHYAHKALHEALVQPFPFDTERGQHFIKIEEATTDRAGGTKVFCSDIYAGAFNHILVHDLADWFLSLPWSNVDTATLSAEGENDDYACIAMFHGQHVRVDSEMVDVYHDTHRLVVIGHGVSPSTASDRTS